MKKHFLLAIITHVIAVFCSSAQLKIITPKGSEVNGLLLNETLSPAQLAAASYSIQQAYPNAIILEDATQKYNCHSYAWYLTDATNTLIPNKQKAWIQGTLNTGYYPARDDDKYWLDGSYVLSATPAHPAKVSYQKTSDPDNANYDHSAVTTSTAGVFISKWGNGPLVQHAYDYCPYMSSEINYYVKSPATVTNTRPLIVLSDVAFDYNQNKSVNIVIDNVGELPSAAGVAVNLTAPEGWTLSETTFTVPVSIPVNGTYTKSVNLTATNSAKTRVNMSAAIQNSTGGDEISSDNTTTLKLLAKPLEIDLVNEFTTPTNNTHSLGVEKTFSVKITNKGMSSSPSFTHYVERPFGWEYAPSQSSTISIPSIEGNGGTYIFSYTLIPKMAGKATVTANYYLPADINNDNNRHCAITVNVIDNIPYANLKPSIAVVSSLFTVGQTQNITITVKNEGLATSMATTMVIGFSPLKTTDFWNSSIGSNQTVSVPALAPNATSMYSFTLTGNTAGSTAIILAGVYGGDSHVVDNGVFKNIKVDDLGGVSQLITRIGAPLYIFDIGETKTIPITITNTGTKTSNPSTLTLQRLTPSENISIWNNSGNYSYIPIGPIEAGQSFVYNYSITAAAGGITSSDKSNFYNASLQLGAGIDGEYDGDISILKINYVDLAVSYPSGSNTNTAPIGVEKTMYVEVINKGTTSSTETTIATPTPNGWILASDQSHSTTIPSLAPNAIFTFSYRCIPQKPGLEAHMVNLSQRDVDDANNKATYNVVATTSSPYIDLVPSISIVDRIVNIGAINTVTVTIDNKGTKVSNPDTLAIVLMDDLGISTNWTSSMELPVAIVNMPAIAAGGSYSFTYTLTANSLATTGGLIAVAVTGDDDVSNNDAFKSLKVNTSNGAYLLVSSTPNSTINFSNGETKTIPITITNIGTKPSIPTQAELTFWTGEDYFTITEPLVLDIPILPANGGTYTFNYTIKANVASGYGKLRFITESYDVNYIYLKTSDASSARIKAGTGDIIINKDLENTELSAVVMPNPVTDILKASISLDEVSEVTMKLFDINGIEKTIKKITGKIGENTVQLDVNNLPSGLYLLHFQSNRQQKTLKVIKL